MAIDGVQLTLTQTATENIYTWTNSNSYILEFGCADENPITISSVSYGSVLTDIPASQTEQRYNRPAGQPYYALRLPGTTQFSNTVGPADNEEGAPVVVITTANNQMISSGDILNLSATANDPEGQNLTYLWEAFTSEDYFGGSTQTNLGGFSNASILNTTWTAPSVTSGVQYVIQLTATDPGGLFGQELIVTTVSPSTQLAPDLTVDTPTRNPSGNLTPGQQFTLTTTVRNGGNGNSASTTLRWRSSSNSLITTGDPSVGTDPVSALSAGGTSSESIILNAPTSPGTNYYGATVDSVTGESNTGNNNSGSVSVVVEDTTAPDLVVDTPTRSPSGNLTPGQSFTLTTTVRNQGDGNSPSTSLRWRRSSDSQINTSDTLIGSDSVSSLSAGGSGQESLAVSAPSSPGTYYYGATVDAVAGESNSGNNASGSISVVVEAADTPPDLTVDVPISTPSSPLEPGESFVLATTVRNIGETNSPSSTLRWRRSSDSQISTSDTQIGTDAVSAIAGGGAGQESISLTAPNSEGTYYYGATVDSVSGESDTGNNASGALAIVVQAVVITAPDLTVDTPTVNPSGNLMVGDSFTLTTTVRNQGDGNSPSTTLRWRRSPNSTINTSDTEVGTDFVTSLSAGGSGQESIPLTAPSTPGTYYYGATVDTVSGESNTNNNNSGARLIVVEAAIITTPDLTVDTPTVSPTGTLEPGENFTLSTIVRNSGDGNSPSTTLTWRRSTNVTITVSDDSVGTDPVSALSPGGSSNESITLSSPNSPGTYYYGATVADVTDESDTGNNNSGAVTIIVEAVVATAPDLTVDTPTVSPSGPFMPGDTFTLTTTVRNMGDADSAATTLRWRAGFTQDIELGNQVGTDAVDVLTSGGGGQESILLTAISSPGTYYYGATVDAVTGESNINNNVSGPLTIVVQAAVTTSPDLTVDTPTVNPSGTLEPGESFTLSTVVRNGGDGNSPSTTLRWRQSSNNNITESDPEVGTDGVAALSPGQSSSESIPLSAPNTPGTYYYGATVDSVSDESDTGNNNSGAATVVVEAVATPNTPPDATVSANPTTVNSGDIVTLDGGAADTQDFLSDLTFLWTSNGGGIFANDSLLDTTWTAPSVTSQQDIILTLTVTDTGGLTDTASVTITVNVAPSTNIDPVANAGPTQNVAAGASVSLDGTGSADSDGNIVSYTWVQTVGDNVVLTDANTSTPDFTAPSTDTAQTLTFRLTVTDDDGATNTDDVNINVAATVAPPIPSAATRLDTINALDSLFTRLNTGPDQGAWVVDDIGTTTSSGTGPGTNSEGPYVFSESSGSDDTLPTISTLTALASVMAAWTGLGRMLLLRACIQGSGSYPNDSASGLQIQGRASSSDSWSLIDLLEGWAYDTNYVVGSTVTDSLGVTQTIVQDGGWVDFVVPIPNDYTQLRIRNIPAMGVGVSAFTHDAALWHMEFRNGSGVPDRPPTVSITTPTGTNVISGNTLNLTAVTSDPDNQNITHLWEAFLSSDYFTAVTPTDIGGFTNNAIRDAIWTAPVVLVNTPHVLQLTVTDTDNLSAFSFIGIVVSPVSVNTDPLAAAGPDQDVAAGTLVTLDGTGSVDSDGTVDAYLWVQTSGDNVVLADADTSTPDFTAPSTSSLQVLTFQLTVTDNAGATDTDTVNVNVAAVIAPAQVVSTGITSNPIALSDTYGEGEVIRIAVTYDEVVTVNTAGGVPDVRANIGSAPGVATFGYVSGTGTATLSFEYTVQASDMDDNGIFLFGSTDSQNRGDIRLNGGTIQANGVNVNLTTTDRGTESGHKVNGSLGAPIAPEFANDTGTPQTWTQGIAIAPITVPSAGGNPAPTYELIGNAPTGISFNISSRVISGTPTEVDSGTIRIRAMNSEGSDDWTVSYSVMADIPDLALPTIANYTRQQNNILSITLPEATGGTTPITYSLTGLPSTLVFDPNTRTFEGTPTDVAGYNLTYTATDSNNDTVSRNFTLAIGAGMVTPITPLPTPTFVDYVGPWEDGDPGNPPNSNRTSLQVVGVLPTEDLAHENVQFLVTPTGDIYRGTDVPGWERIFVNGLIGEIKDYGGAATPPGYLWCDGAEYSRTLYPELFAAIGILWGNGNGATTFNVPDARGYVTMGRGQTRGPVGLGVGDKGGAADHTLSINEMPTHQHVHNHAIKSPLNLTAGTTDTIRFGVDVPVSPSHPFAEQPSILAPAGTNIGGSGSHNNIQPTAVVNKVIRY